VCIPCTPNLEFYFNKILKALFINWGCYDMKKYKRFGAQSMSKILCPHCEGKLQIVTSKQIVKAVRDVYTNCNNPTCLARPIMCISHKGDSQPPIGKVLSPSQVVANLLKSLSKEDLQQVMFEFPPEKMTG